MTRRFVQDPSRSTKTPVGTVCNTLRPRCPVCGNWTWQSAVDKRVTDVFVGQMLCLGRRGTSLTIKSLRTALADPIVKESRPVIASMLMRMRYKLQDALREVREVEALVFDQTLREAFAFASPAPTPGAVCVVSRPSNFTSPGVGVMEGFGG